jgi:hypothetical protein
VSEIVLLSLKILNSGIKIFQTPTKIKIANNRKNNMVLTVTEKLNRDSPNITVKNKDEIKRSNTTHPPNIWFL